MTIPTPPILRAPARLVASSATLLVLVEAALGAGAGQRIAAAFLASDEVVAVDIVVRRAGFSDRRQLRRTLASEGHGSPVRLVGALRITRWLWRAETLGESLAAQVLGAGRDPAVAYRLVKARSGFTWGECRQRGTAWFVENVLRPHAGLPLAGADVVSKPFVRAAK